MLRHALDDDLEEEPRVFHELADHQLIGVSREKHRLQVVRQLLVHTLLFNTRYRLRHKHVLQIKPWLYINTPNKTMVVYLMKYLH